MNGIGITEWQNNQTDYPLKSAGKLSGIFCDASFVQFDGFIPILNSVSIVSDKLQMVFTMDDGTQTFEPLIADISQGYKYRLRSNNRYYGVVVFGRSIDSIISGVYGASITAGYRFESCTVRSIDSTNGVYSLQGNYGDVSITFDKNIRYGYTDKYVFDAISVPNNLDVVQTSASSLYSFSNSNKVSALDFGTGTSTSLTSLITGCNILYNHDSRLLGFDNTAKSLYILNNIPGIKLFVTQPNVDIKAMAADNLGKLWLGANINKSAALIWVGTWVPSDGNYSQDNGPSNGIINKFQIRDEANALVDISLSNLNSIVYVNNQFIISVDGDYDYVSSLYYSSKFYVINEFNFANSSCVVAALGILRSPSSHLPQIKGLLSFNNSLIGWIINNTNNVVYYNINTSNLRANMLHTYIHDSVIGNILSVFVGGPAIALNSVTPLKTINGMTPINNHVYIKGNDAVNITQSANDTLTLSLTISDQNLNVRRTTQYE